LPAVCYFVVGLSTASAAELGTPLDDYEVLHKRTDYGALFFNKEATNKLENNDTKNFAIIDGDGDISLPMQAGYCFLFNHYDPRRGYRNSIRSYGAMIIKWKSTGKTSSEPFSGNFIPTADPDSDDPPDLCVNGLQDVIKVEIRFSFDHAPSFTRRILFSR
jgi:hypothetical protein